MPLEIDYLAHHRETIAELAAWHHAEWSHLSPGRSLEARTRGLEDHAAVGSIPTAFVALLDDQLVGSASLVECDLETHPELSPWLAGVYVRSDARGSGIGTSLVMRVMYEARTLGVPCMYLFTHDGAPFYERLGWHELFRERVAGEEEVIMQATLEGP